MQEDRYFGEEFARGIAMSQAFDVLSSAVDEAIENSKAKKKFLREETLSIEIESSVEYIAKHDTLMKIKYGEEQGKE